MNPTHVPADELRALQEGAGLVDLAAEGRLEVRGADRLAHLHGYTTNALTGLAPGQGAWAAVTTIKGRVRDLVQVLALPDRALVLTSANQAEALRTHLERYVFDADASVDDLGPATTSLGLYGPRARQVLDTLGVPATPPDGSATATVAEVEVLAAAHPLGYRLLAPREAGTALREALARAGAVPAGAAAFETARIVHGWPARPAELNEEVNPWEVRLDPYISLSKGCYLGQEVVARLQAYDKVQRRLTGLDLEAWPDELPAPLHRAGDPSGSPVGTLTSAALLPDGRLVGLGLVKVDVSGPGIRLVAGTSGAAVGATTVTRPWWADQASGAPERPLSKF